MNGHSIALTRISPANGASLISSERVNGDHANGTSSSSALETKATSVWDSKLTSSLPDPTRVFSILVISVMIVRNAHSANWDFTLAMTSGFLLNPYVATFFLMAIVALYYGNYTCPKNARSLPVYDRWTAEWYWWNSWLFHMTMDGASGSLRLVPVVVQQYDIMDLRFPNRHVVPWIIGMVELLIMGPLCMITVIAILQRHQARFALELIISTLHIMGMIVFVAAEVYEGQLAVPALDPVGIPANRWANIKFNFYHLVYYWFAFWFCNLVWGVVPLIRIQRALQECSQKCQASSSSSNVEPTMLRVVKKD
jgi:EXPERA (EXPanded EBP superfamily)